MLKRTALAIAFLGPAALSAQQESIASWIAFDAPVGLEMRTTPSLIPILNAYTGGTWRADALGNLVLRKGSGSPKRVVACGIDRAGFAVTHITADGMLRLHRVGNVAHPLWDQAHEGQQLEILTERGPVTGVAAIANGHFAQQHRRDSLIATADELYLDVGASSPAEVASLGIRLLDPVQRRLDAWQYGDYIAGSFAAQRAGCAALVTAARGDVQSGETMFIISTQSTLGWPGLGGVLARTPQFSANEITLLMGGRAAHSVRWARASALPAVNVGVFRAARADSVRVISPMVRHANTLVESIDGSEATWLLGEVTKAAGTSSSGTNAWASIPRRRRVSAHADTPAAGDPHASTMKLLASLADLPGVPTHEWRVREAIRAALPAWAQQRAVVDSIGNLIVSIGPARDTVVFMAHMDEVAYHVASIRGDGTVTLRERGGVVSSAWEGQPALLHLPRPANGVADTIAGVFIPRDSARLRNPGTLTAWFGMDSAALAARRVRVGLGVNSPKVSARLFGPRFTGRSMDDRAGSTALILAARRLDPAKLDHAVVLVWSVQEEGGLVGAQAAAASMGASAQRIYSIDTFVSSETPLESPHFAYVKLGQGPVLRAIETGSISPPAVRARVVRAAQQAGIPLQLGLTQGGTDGTAFTFYGAPNTGLSWPGRYSHTPAEVLDLRDVERLAVLIHALAVSR